MGWKPNIITDPIDRLETSIGNWVSVPNLLTGGFVWMGTYARIFQDLFLTLSKGTLAKDFFSPLVLYEIHRIRFDAFWPSSSHEGSLDFLIWSSTVISYGVSISKNPPDTWRSIEANFIPGYLFDNNLRYMLFSLNNIENTPIEVFVKNLSVQYWSEARVQYLPIMGVG